MAYQGEAAFALIKLRKFMTMKKLSVIFEIIDNYTPHKHTCQYCKHTFRKKSSIRGFDGRLERLHGADSVDVDKPRRGNFVA